MGDNRRNIYPHLSIVGVSVRLQELRGRRFRLRQSGALFLLVFGFSARGAEKPNTDNRKVPCCRRQNLLQTRATA